MLHNIVCTTYLIIFILLYCTKNVIENAIGGLNEHPIHFTNWCHYISMGYKHYMSVYTAYLYCITTKYAIILRQDNMFKYSCTS